MIGSDTLTTNRKQLVKVNALTIVSAYGLTTLHHIYGGVLDNAPNRLTVPVIMAVPTVAALVALHRYERTGSKAALATAATVTSIAWVGLSGLLHGAYAHAYKDVLFLTGSPAKLYYSLNPSEHYPPDDLLFETTGVLEVAAAFLVGWSTYRLIAQHGPKARSIGSSDSPRRAQGQDPGGEVLGGGIAAAQDRAHPAAQPKRSRFNNRSGHAPAQGLPQSSSAAR